MNDPSTYNVIGIKFKLFIYYRNLKFWGYFIISHVFKITFNNSWNY